MVGLASDPLWSRTRWSLAVGICMVVGLGKHIGMGSTRMMMAIKEAPGSVGCCILVPVGGYTIAGDAGHQ